MCTWTSLRFEKVALMAEPNQSKGLSVHDAVRVAAAHLQQLYPKAEHVLLEEVELSDDDNFWFVTLSLIGPAGPLGQHLPALGIGERKYKVIKINRSTGEVRSVKIREGVNV